MDMVCGDAQANWAVHSNSRRRYQATMFVQTFKAEPIISYSISSLENITKILGQVIPEPGVETPVALRRRLFLP